MKSISLILNVLLILGILYLLFWNKPTHDDKKPNKPGEPSFCSDCDDYNPGERYGMISFATAKMLADNYGAGDGKKYIYEGATNTGQLDARNIWFDLEILKNFIAFVEKNTCQAKCDTSQHLGVRIYYGKYPDSTKLDQYPDLVDVPAEYGNHHTVFMMPTYYDAVKNKHYDFDPMKIGTDCKLSPFDNSTNSLYGVNPISPVPGTRGVDLKQRQQVNVDPRQVDVKPQDPRTYFVFGPSTHKLLYISSSVETGDNQNHGSIAPPPDEEGEFPTD